MNKIVLAVALLMLGATAYADNLTDARYSCTVDTSSVAPTLNTPIMFVPWSGGDSTRIDGNGRMRARSAALFPAVRHVTSGGLSNGAFYGEAVLLTLEPINGLAATSDSLRVVTFSGGRDTTVSATNWTTYVVSSVIYNSSLYLPGRFDSLYIYGRGATSQIKQRLRITAWGGRSR